MQSEVNWKSIWFSLSNYFWMQLQHVALPVFLSRPLKLLVGFLLISFLLYFTDILILLKLDWRKSSWKKFLTRTLSEYLKVEIGKGKIVITSSTTVLSLYLHDSLVFSTNYGPMIVNFTISSMDQFLRVRQATTRMLVITCKLKKTVAGLWCFISFLV